MSTRRRGEAEVIVSNGLPLPRPSPLCEPPCVVVVAGADADADVIAVDCAEVINEEDDVVVDDVWDV